MLEFSLELANEERGLFLVSLFEDMPDADEDRPGNRGDGARNGERHEEKEFLAEAQGAASSEALGRSSEPSGLNWRSRTRGLDAYARGRWSTGTRVFRSRNSRSALYSATGSE